MAQIITSQHIYIYAVVFDVGVLFASFCVQKRGPWFRSKMGRTTSEERKPLFLQCFGVLGGNELSQRCKYPASCLGHIVTKSLLNTHLAFLRSFSSVGVRVAVRLAFFVAVSKRLELRENGVFAVRIPKNSIIPKNGVSNKWAKHIFRPRSSQVLCFSWSRLNFHKTFFVITQISLKALKTAVPKWRREKAIFAPEGLKQAILAVAAKEAQ